MAAQTTLFILALCLVLCSGVNAATEERKTGFVVFFRKLSGDLVQGRNVTVSYEVHNVGKSPARRVTLRDNAFPPSRFEILSGSFKQMWPIIAAGESETLEVKIQPKRAGELYVNPPAIVYSDGEIRRTTRLSAEESLVVEDQIAYRRRTDKHGTEWGIYFVVLAALVALPYGLYVSVKPPLDTASASKKN